MTNFLLVVLILLVLAVGVLVVFYNRQKLRESVKPLVVSFKKSMQYRTINKDDTEGIGDGMPKMTTTMSSSGMPPAVNV